MDVFYPIRFRQIPCWMRFDWLHVAIEGAPFSRSAQSVSWGDLDHAGCHVLA
jgi:hypothetical protein